MGSQHTAGGPGHGNDRPTEGHRDLAARGVAFRAVYVMMFSGVLGAVPAAAQPTMSLPAVQPYTDLSAARGRANPPGTSLRAAVADSTSIDGPAPGDDGAEAPPRAVDLPRRLPVWEYSEPWDNGMPYAARREMWAWQRLPDGVVYPSYLAAPKEPRFAMVFNHVAHLGWMCDLEAGGRVALVRYGTEGPQRPEGWELDIEGAAFPRLDLDHDEDLISADYRVGIPLTYGFGPFQTKLAVYHLSSHLGDEFLLRFPESARINYSRNALVLGGSYSGMTSSTREAER